MTLSREMENRLLRAVQTTVDNVAGGMTPTQAVIKAAEASRLPRGGIEKVCHAYNTGRTTRQREDGGSLVEKTADFPLADPAQAIAAIFPDTIKSASEIVAQHVVAADYFRSPTAGTRRTVQDAGLLKRAGASCTVAAPAPKKPMPKPEAGPAIRRAFGERDRAHRDTEEARRMASMARDKAAASFGRLKSLLSSFSAPPIDVVRRNVEIMHGKTAASVLDRLVLVYPDLPKLPQHKVAGYARERHAAAPAEGPIYAAVLQVMTDAADFRRAELAHEAAKTANDARAEVALRPFVPPHGGDPSINDPASPTLSQLHGFAMQRRAEREKAAAEKRAFPPLWQSLGSAVLAKGMFDAFANDIKAPDTDKLVGKTLNKLTDPEHESKLRAINTQATLQDFMLNDPVISGHDPNEVMDAFNEITQLSPSMADQRLPLQALLRKRLQQGSLDSFDTNQALQTEQLMRQRNLMPKPLGTTPTA